MGEVFTAMVIAGQERIENAFENWVALSKVNPESKETEDAQLAYAETVDSANDLKQIQL